MDALSSHSAEKTGGPQVIAGRSDSWSWKFLDRIIYGMRFFILCL